jgi:hypothetical protein
MSSADSAAALATISSSLRSCLIRIGMLVFSVPRASRAWSKPVPESARFAYTTTCAAFGRRRCAACRVDGMSIRSITPVIAISGGKAVASKAAASLKTTGVPANSDGWFLARKETAASSVAMIRSKRCER